MKKSIILSLVISVFLSISAQASSTDKINISDLHTVTQKTGVVTIDGTAKNNTNETIKSVSIHFNLYKDNALVGYAIDTASGISPNKSWEISAFTGKTFDKYELSEIKINE